MAEQMNAWTPPCTVTRMHALEQVAKEGAPPAGRREEERRTQQTLAVEEKPCHFRSSQLADNE